MTIMQSLNLSSNFWLRGALLITRMKTRRLFISSCSFMRLLKKKVQVSMKTGQQVMNQTKLIPLRPVQFSPLPISWRVSVPMSTTTLPRRFSCTGSRKTMMFHQWRGLCQFRAVYQGCSTESQRGWRWRKRGLLRNSKPTVSLQRY